MRGLNVTIVYVRPLKLIYVPKSFYELRIKIKLEVICVGYHVLDVLDLLERETTKTWETSV